MIPVARHRDPIAAPVYGRVSSRMTTWPTRDVIKFGRGQAVDDSITVRGTPWHSFIRNTLPSMSDMLGIQGVTTAMSR